MSKTFNQVLQFSLTGVAVEVEGQKYYKFAQLFMQDEQIRVYGGICLRNFLPCNVYAQKEDTLVSLSSTTQMAPTDGNRLTRETENGIE